MKKSNRSIKRKGFTLVELLIVIVVIGILSAMMMLSSTEAVTSAKASNIVSNLRNLKTAALSCYVDSLDKWADGTDAPEIKDVVVYLNNGSDLPDKDNYGIANNSGEWYVVYHITGSANEVKKIGEKLKGRTSSLGLKKGSTSVTTVPNGDYDGSEYVGMLIR